MWVWRFYGLAISLCSLASVLMMARANRQMRRNTHDLQRAFNHITIAAANMWDTLTPEQIRSLHPSTVAVGNNVPSWDYYQRMMHEVANEMKEPNQQDKEPG